MFVFYLSVFRGLVYALKLLYQALALVYVRRLYLH
jgi:hypothetical protein